MISRILSWYTRTQAIRKLERIVRERRESYEVRQYRERRAAAKLGIQRKREGARA